MFFTTMLPGRNGHRSLEHTKFFVNDGFIKKKRNHIFIERNNKI